MQGKKISFTIHNFKFKYVRQKESTVCGIKDKVQTVWYLLACSRLSRENMRKYERVFIQLRGSFPLSHIFIRS